MASRKDDVIGDVERMLGVYWEPEIAKKCGYKEPHALYTALKKWGRPDLARRFLKVNYDGLTDTARATAYARSQGAVI